MRSNTNMGCNSSKDQIADQSQTQQRSDGVEEEAAPTTTVSNQAPSETSANSNNDKPSETKLVGILKDSSKSRSASPIESEVIDETLSDNECEYIC